MSSLSQFEKAILLISLTLEDMNRRIAKLEEQSVAIQKWLKENEPSLAAPDNIDED